MLERALAFQSGRFSMKGLWLIDLDVFLCFKLFDGCWCSMFVTMSCWCVDLFCVCSWVHSLVLKNLVRVHIISFCSLILQPYTSSLQFACFVCSFAWLFFYVFVNVFNFFGGFHFHVLVVSKSNFWSHNHCIFFSF